MSLTKTIEISCPKCKEKQNFKVWQSVNVTEDAKLRDIIFSGEIFTFTCEKCGTKTFIAYPMIYHDLAKKFFIYFNPEGDFSNLIETEGFVTRKTSDYLEMLELIKIFEDEMSEEYVKNLKNKLFDKLKQAGNEQVKKVDKAYYGGKTGEKVSFYLPQIKSKVDIEM